MLREQMINFLQAAIVFLLLTNAITALAALYAMRMANALARPTQAVRGAVERKLETILDRST
jgi:hypothetical protein